MITALNYANGSLFVFDEQGKPWGASSGALKCALNSSIGGTVLVDYTVMNLGFVAAKHAGGAARIRLRPAIVSGATLAALFYWLHSIAPERIVISWLEDFTWSHALLASPDAAILHLSELRRL